MVEDKPVEYCGIELPWETDLTQPRQDTKCQTTHKKRPPKNNRLLKL